VIDTTNITIGNRRNGDRGIYVGRPTALGNPYVVGTDGQPGTLVEPYRRWLRERIRLADAHVIDALTGIAVEIERSGGAQLVCWCAPAPCHARAIRDVLAQLDWCSECERHLALACDHCGTHACARHDCGHHDGSQRRS
jgi:hypothetical protein